MLYHSEVVGLDLAPVLLDIASLVLTAALTVVVAKVSSYFLFQKPIYFVEIKIVHLLISMFVLIHCDYLFLAQIIDKLKERRGTFDIMMVAKRIQVL